MFETPWLHQIVTDVKNYFVGHRPFESLLECGKNGWARALSAGVIPEKNFMGRSTVPPPPTLRVLEVKGVI